MHPHSLTNSFCSSVQAHSYSIYFIGGCGRRWTRVDFVDINLVVLDFYSIACCCGVRINAWRALAAYRTTSNRSNNWNVHSIPVYWSYSDAPNTNAWADGLFAWTLPHINGRQTVFRPCARANGSLNSTTYQTVCHNIRTDIHAPVLNSLTAYCRYCRPFPYSTYYFGWFADSQWSSRNVQSHYCLMRLLVLQSPLIRCVD